MVTPPTVTADGVLWLDRCASTNIEALKRLDQPSIRAICAVEQTAGRGRQGRTWFSDTSLCMSWIARPDFSLSHGGLLPLMAAVVLAEYCESLGVTATLKWPNDLLVDGRKLAGILCEARTEPTGWAAVVGIGLNLVTPPNGWPADVPGVAMDTLIASPPERAQLACGVVHRLGRALPALASVSGRRRVIRDWMDYASPFGTPMRRGPVVGTFAGLAPDGALRLQTDAGVELVHAGDVELLEVSNGQVS
ncbi:MAG: BirA family biotin operon repressor/biotin-[acetyl-CoA-carboxylase] ligase, partial [Bradymonadia bacterium]